MKPELVERLSAKLHQKNLKSTPLRLYLLQVFEQEHGPLSVDELQTKLKKVDYDPASLFRSLKKFAEAELIRAVDLGEGFIRYESACHEHGHHHHIMCIKCKKIETIPFCISPEIEKHLKKSGYTNLTHRMDFFGLCRNCS